ncbi:hypothetical protein DH2020_004888 [Rehmannia glutinosa]|uniref:F-box domain-containing protein n=1 Tax=Rehmannia glutinosa TaxID=99300 RepID=A0ABR0XQR4_REHGL
MTPNQTMFTCSCNLIFPCLNLFRESLCRRSCSGLIDMPDSVIHEIFMKLPISSIIRCKCVCKSWYKLIVDPLFANIYVRNTPFTATAILRYKIILLPYPLDDRKPPLFFLEIGKNGDFIRTPNALGFPANGFVVSERMSSGHGLLCLVNSPLVENERNGDRIYNDQTVCIVNPLSGVCLFLPDVMKDEGIERVVYGFGSSTSTNEYKVIRFVIRHRHERKAFLQILTIGLDNKWRHFEDSSVPCNMLPGAVTLSGVIHWIGFFPGIFAFDIRKERGWRIAFPPGIEHGWFNISFGAWDGHLCLANAGNIQVDVWVLKKYGVAENWTRNFILRKSWMPSDLWPCPLFPIKTLRNGDILMSRGSGETLISFDHKTNKFRKRDVSDVESSDRCSAFVWIRSVFRFIRGYQPAATSAAGSRIICPFQSLYQLGDSTLDTGNLVRVLPVGPTLPAARPPYGNTFPDASGRWSTVDSS